MNETRIEIEKMIESNDLAGLLQKTALIHGHHCVGSAMGVIAAHHAMKAMGIVQNTGMEHLIAVVETNSCFSDGVQMVTGCSFGNNSLCTGTTARPPSASSRGAARAYACPFAQT